MGKTNAERAEETLLAYINHTGDDIRANGIETWIIKRTDQGGGYVAPQGAPKPYTRSGWIDLRDRRSSDRRGAPRRSSERLCSNRPTGGKETTMNAIVNPTTLTAASHQWATRPADERYTSLIDMSEHFNRLRGVSRDRVISSRGFRASPVDGDHKGLVVEALVGRAGSQAEVCLPTHWSFGQLAQLSGAPASYLRKLPSELAADCFNYGMRQRDVSEVKFLLRDQFNPGVSTLSAATGPNYGRIWNGDIVDALISRFGDGVEGAFKVPGEFGQDVPVTKENTTLYASDRDMFVFLADEANRIEIADRRGGKAGNLARGFFVWNSEVGDGTFGIATFLFDYVCKNRIVWGAEGYKEIRIRHTSGAPDRYVEEVAPALIAYANSETHSITTAIENARQARVENIDDFLSARFTSGQIKGIKLAHEVDEDRPIETVWDAVTGITAYARGIPNQNDRVAIERAAGVILNKAS